MEQPLPALVLQIFGFAVSILALLAESQSQYYVNSPATPPSPHLPTSPSPPSCHHLRSPAPPDMPRRKAKIGSNDCPKQLPSPQSPHLPTSPPPSSFRHLRSPPPQDRRRRKANIRSNRGKMLGLLFVSIAAILQIGVVGFLAFKRSQLLKLEDIYETGS